MKKDAKIFNLGRHLLAEYYECNPNILNNVQLIEEVMTEAAVRCGATVVQKNFHHFSPYGVSGVVIIAESHLTIHTWPEYGYASVDLFTCGDSCNPHVAYEYLQEKLNSGSALFSELKRGLIHEETKGQPSPDQLIKTPFVVSMQQQTYGPGKATKASAPKVSAQSSTAKKAEKVKAGKAVVTSIGKEAR